MVLFCIPCFLLLVVIALLGIFFPKYRPLIREAWDCFWKKLTLRPCEVSFDKKAKSKITAYLMRKNRLTLARLNNRYFETVTTILGILLIILMIFLTILFIKWIVIGNSPCASGTCPVN